MNRIGLSLFRSVSNSGASTAIVTTCGLAVSSALNLVALLVWVRLLSPAAFGTLALVTAAGLIANALAFEWLRLAGARTLFDAVSPDEIAPAGLAAWIRTSGWSALLLAGAAVIAGMAGVGPPGLPPVWNGAIVLIAASEMLLAAVTLVARLRLRASTYAAMMVGRSALALALGALSVRLGLGAAGVVGGLVLGQLLIAAVAALRDPLWRLAIHARPSTADRRELIRVGVPLIAGSALALVAAMIDRYLVGAQLGVAAAGQFAAPAELVAKTLGFAMMAVNLSAYPLLVRTYELHGETAAARAVERNGAVLLAVALPIVSVIVFLGRPLSAALLGARYPLAPILLPWLAGAAALRLLVTFHFGVALQLARRTKLLLPPPALSLLILLLGASPAMGAAGLKGLAMLLFAAQLAGAVLAAMLAGRVLGARLLTPAIARVLAANVLLCLLLGVAR